MGLRVVVIRAIKLSPNTEDNHMPKPRNIGELIDSKYADDDVRDYIRRDVDERGTADRIMSGEAVLPHEDDARRAMVHAQGVKDVPSDPHAQAQLISDWTQRLVALERQVALIIQQINSILNPPSGSPPQAKGGA